jgi:hypothetical protein
LATKLSDDGNLFDGISGKCLRQTVRIECIEASDSSKLGGYVLSTRLSAEEKSSPLFPLPNASDVLSNNQSKNLLTSVYDWIFG